MRPSTSPFASRVRTSGCGVRSSFTATPHERSSPHMNDSRHRSLSLPIAARSTRRSTESSISACSLPTTAFPEAVIRDRRPPATQPSVIASSGLGKRTDVAPAVHPRGCRAIPSPLLRCTERIRTPRSGSRDRAPAPAVRGPKKLWTFVRRSAKTSGCVSASDSKTLIWPLFSATTTRPSADKRTAAGLVSPTNNGLFRENRAGTWPWTHAEDPPSAHRS